MIKRQWFMAGRYTDSDGIKHDFSCIVSIRSFFGNASMAKAALRDALKKDGVDWESIVICRMNRV